MADDDRLTKADLDAVHGVGFDGDLDVLRDDARDIASEIADLVAEGRVIPATNREPFVMPSGPVDVHNAASAALLAMRDEERY